MMVVIFAFEGKEATASSENRWLITGFNLLAWPATNMGHPI